MCGGARGAAAAFTKSDKENLLSISPKDPAEEAREHQHKTSEQDISPKTSTQKKTLRRKRGSINREHQHKTSALKTLRRKRESINQKHHHKTSAQKHQHKKKPVEEAREHKHKSTITRHQPERPCGGSARASTQDIIPRHRHKNINTKKSLQRKRGSINTRHQNKNINPKDPAEEAREHQHKTSARDIGTKKHPRKSGGAQRATAGINLHAAHQPCTEASESRRVCGLIEISPNSI